MVARERRERLEHYDAQSTGRIEKLIALCKERGVRVRAESREQLTRLADTTTRYSRARQAQKTTLEDLSASAPPRLGSKVETPRRLILALDGIENHETSALFCVSPMVQASMAS